MTSGLYIQVPFCKTKCTYCNFHTGVFSSQLYEPYARAVCREIEIRARDDAWAVFDTAYFGGGTPSLLAPENLARILDAARRNFDCRFEEITLEADPETITREKAEAWLAEGFNRVSLGAQSFNDVELQAAGRMHRRADIAAAVFTLRAAGFRNLTLDLIAGLPHQTADSWRESVEGLMRLEPEHISIYLMEIDEGSRLGREAISGGGRYSAGELPSDDAMADSYELASGWLADAGYEHYEISNWARPGFRSRHNLKYWRREPYLGLGAGAHSFDGRRRWADAHDPAAYVASIGRGNLPTEQESTVGEREALEEQIFLGLRQMEGIDLGVFAGAREASLLSRIEEMRRNGLVIVDGGRLRLAPGRLTVSNDVLVELMEAV